ncbi:hypothetical protein H9L15_09675 [Sphingomonas daechungensis]|uniref:Heavy-metal-associated domain-containing protein n=1 Tax=Sphingomonas daechungensis TaxID=1176646 RepID=A0ABX6SYI0_9SPHN|nr:hypothetical protein [Sphingomonas daechungensis]QNP42520.1 hypothetical protein H9L15_09675 [Sphingomonas daechungensis]
MTFTITAPAGAGTLQIMRAGVQRMDGLFADALASGRLVRDRTLDIPEPPPPPVVEEAPVQQAQPWAYQIQIVSPDVNIYNFAMAHLRTSPGVDQVVPVSINPGGVSYVNVTYRGGNIANLRTSLGSRGWNVEQNGFVLRMSTGSAGPPPLPHRCRPSRSRPAAAAARHSTRSPGSGAERQRMKRGRTRSRFRSTGRRRKVKPGSSSLTPTARRSNISANGACGR